MSTSLFSDDSLDPGRRKKKGQRGPKGDLVATTYSRQLGFRGACCEYIKTQASGMDPSLKLRLDAEGISQPPFLAQGARPEGLGYGGQRGFIFGGVGTLQGPIFYGPGGFFGMGLSTSLLVSPPSETKVDVSPDFRAAVVGPPPSRCPASSGETRGFTPIKRLPSMPSAQGPGLL
ncbi:hypothetical protein L0F63_007058 [Massospora cicadina]|nr:hypothetical protein L0F63_007058 [Massospora cicadina]